MSGGLTPENVTFAVVGGPADAATCGDVVLSVAPSMDKTYTDTIKKAKTSLLVRCLPQDNQKLVVGPLPPGWTIDHNALRYVNTYETDDEGEPKSQRSRPRSLELRTFGAKGILYFLISPGLPPLIPISRLSLPS